MGLGVHDLHLDEMLDDQINAVYQIYILLFFNQEVKLFFFSDPG